MTMNLATRLSTADDFARDQRRMLPDENHWPDIIGQIGTEVGPSLTAALERVTALASTGKIDRAGLRQLREEIEHARRAGMIGQQLTRFASGRIRQAPEQVSVTQMLREVLLQHGRAAAARQLEVRQALRPAEVIADPTLLHALLEATVDWGLGMASSCIEFKIDFKPWPPFARLTVRFTHARREASSRPTAGQPAHDSMAWRLVQQISWTLNLVVERSISQEETLLTIEFPRTVHDQLEGVSVVEIDHGFDVSGNSKPLAGSHVLVLAGGRELRADIKESIRHMGLLVDFVSSVEEAEEFCRDALPHALIYEQVLVNERFQKLRAGIRAEIANFVFIELAPEGAGLRLSASGEGALIGRNAVLHSLPSALIFELSHTL